MAKFQLGQLTATRGVADLMAENAAFARFTQISFARYQRGDWGDLCEEDAAMNDSAATNGDDRILAAYDNAEHPAWKIWIITEWDRSATTILFPSEY